MNDSAHDEGGRATSPDITEIFERFKLPNFDVDGFVSERRADIDAVTKATSNALSSAQELAAKQADLLKATLGEMGDAMKHWPDDAKAPAEALAKQREFVQNTLTRTLESMREMAEAAQKSQTEIAQIATDRMRANAERVRSLFDRKA